MEKVPDIPERDPRVIAWKAARMLGGGPRAIAEAIGGVTSQAVYSWKIVPAHRVLTVEKVTGVSRHILRPDVFGAVEQVDQIARQYTPRRKVTESSE